MHGTNIELDEKLVKVGLRLFKKKTKKKLVHFALTELIRWEKAKKLLKLEGKIRWEGNLKQMRKSSRNFGTWDLMEQARLDVLHPLP